MYDYINQGRQKFTKRNNSVWDKKLCMEYQLLRCFGLAFYNERVKVPIHHKMGQIIPQTLICNIIQLEHC